MEDVIDSVSYDQYKNIPTADENGIKSKVIFSYEAYSNLLRLIKNTRDSDRETGCFFVGIQTKNNNVLAYKINDFTSDFECEDALVPGGSAYPKEQNYRELNEKINKYKINNEKATVFHFHTHPRQLHYENFSDQDLHIYAKMAFDNKDVTSLGILGFPVPDSERTNGISIVFPLNPQVNNNIASANFFRLPNIYHCVKNEIYKVGSFEKRYNGRTSKENCYGSIVRNAVEQSNSNEISGVGMNPNTGKRIEDESVGYIDANGTYCFPYENLNLEFVTLRRNGRSLDDE